MSQVTSQLVKELLVMNLEFSYVVRVEYEDDIVDTYADNDNFELEGDKIIDFSSDNPFGMLLTLNSKQIKTRLMFEYFYNEIFRSVIIGFGSMFNGIEIQHKNEADNSIKL